jgi:hypothetical protein
MQKGAQVLQSGIGNYSFSKHLRGAEIGLFVRCRRLQLPGETVANVGLQHADQATGWAASASARWCFAGWQGKLHRVYIPPCGVPVPCTASHPVRRPDSLKDLANICLQWRERDSFPFTPCETDWSWHILRDPSLDRQASARAGKVPCVRTGVPGADVRARFLPSGSGYGRSHPSRALRHRAAPKRAGMAGYLQNGLLQLLRCLGPRSPTLSGDGPDVSDRPEMIEFRRHRA